MNFIKTLRERIPQEFYKNQSEILTESAIVKENTTTN